MNVREGYNIAYHGYIYHMDFSLLKNLATSTLKYSAVSCIILWKPENKSLDLYYSKVLWFDLNSRTVADKGSCARRKNWIWKIVSSLNETKNLLRKDSKSKDCISVVYYHLKWLPQYATQNSVIFQQRWRHTH